MAKKKYIKKMQKDIISHQESPMASDQLYNDICSIINGARHRLATYANMEVCSTNWSIGKRIKEDVLHNQRADYGKQIVIHLSERLTQTYGKGWSQKTLLHCLRCAETFTQEEIVSAVQRQLTWTHLKTIMYISDELQRQFYLTMCSIEHWDTRTLADKIDSQLYLRTAISQKSEEVIRQELQKAQTTHELSPDLVFRSSYFLDMLGLHDSYSEKDLEDAILSQIQAFIHELGTDFTFVDRQHRISVDAVDYYIDLLFYHRGLQRLVAIDLKLGKFKPEYEGQMRLYLRYLNKNERKAGEQAPIGLILCSEGNTEHVEYFMLDEDDSIRVAQYYTQLPDKAVLANRLQRAIAIAKEHKKEQE